MRDTVATEPLVSVVIPCFNSEDTVGQAIESALNQIYLNREVIVIDDGSTDESLQVVRSFGKGVRWETRENQGGGAARNRGLEIAEGVFIQFLDADDMLMPGKLECQVPHALSLGPAAMSICKGSTIGDDPYLNWQYSRELNVGRDPVDFVLGGVLPTPAPLHLRKNLIAVGGFDESLPCAQEFDLHLRLVTSGLELVQLRKILFAVSQQPGSVSSNSLKVVSQRRYILRKALQILRSRRVLTSSRTRLFAVAYARAAMVLELGGCQDEADDCFAEARELWPDAEVSAWTPRWRPLVRIFGSVRTARFRRWVKSLHTML